MGREKPADWKLTNAGGLFGILGSGSGKLSVHAGANNERLQIKASVTDVNPLEGNSRGVGGIIGRLGWNNSAAKVNVSDVDIDLASSGSSDVGGVIGNHWGSSVEKVDNVSVRAAVAGCEFFGGATGVTRANEKVAVTVLVNNLTVATAAGKPITSGGGVVGRANCKTVIRLSGTTDLSEVCYKEKDGLGQIASLNTAKNYGGPLIFATGSGNDEGWTLVRGKNEKNGHPELDDIGGYGEVIRLGGNLPKDFLKVDETTGTLTIEDSNRSAATISSVEDFARLAIAWETNGIFGSVPDSKWSSMKISLTSDIDLTGTGICGLTRECADDDKAATNSISGNGHTLTLSIGEAYGTWDGTTKVGAEAAGNGRIYRHKRLGLFAAGNGRANDLTIAGTINVDAQADDMAVGALPPPARPVPIFRSITLPARRR